MKKTKSEAARLALLTMLTVLCMVLAGCNEIENPATAPFAHNDYRGGNYLDIVAELEEAGFQNIETETMLTFSESEEYTVGGITINGDHTFRKGAVYGATVPVIVSYYKMQEEQKPSAEVPPVTEELPVEDAQPEAIPQETERAAIPLDGLQTFFTEIPTDVTMTELEKMISDEDLYFSKTKEKEHGYVMYMIAAEQRKYSYGSFNGKTMNCNAVFCDCVAVSFSAETEELEYFMYINFYGPYDGLSYSVYYNGGRFGDINSILWDEMTVEQMSGKYLYQTAKLEWSDDERLVTLHFRSEDDVPYYYRGKEIQPGFELCDNAEDAVRKTIR